MPRKGKSLEQLVATIEKALTKKEFVTVESPAKLRDITNRKPREHDVLLTIKQGHHSIQVAIECRDRSRPITVNQVEGFWAKCQHTGIDQGIMVSSNGFYNTARTKADHLGIRCLDIEEVESFNWLLAPGLHSIIRRLLHSEWTFIPVKEGIADKTNMEVMDKNGNVLTQAILTSNALKQLEIVLAKFPEPIEHGEIKVKLKGENLVMRNKESGEVSDINFVIVHIHYSVVEEIVPFQKVQYLDKGAEELVTDAAVANIEFGEHAGKIMIVYKEDEGGKVVYIPNNKT